MKKLLMRLIIVMFSFAASVLAARTIVAESFAIRFTFATIWTCLTTFMFLVIGIRDVREAVRSANSLQILGFAFVPRNLYDRVPPSLAIALALAGALSMGFGFASSKFWPVVVAIVLCWIADDVVQRAELRRAVRARGQGANQ